MSLFRNAIERREPRRRGIRTVRESCAHLLEILTPRRLVRGRLLCGEEIHSCLLYDRRDILASLIFVSRNDLARFKRPDNIDCLKPCFESPMRRLSKVLWTLL
jgi:hypothetical protein